MHLPEAKQVFGAVAEELLFIWEVSSFLGVYSLFFVLFLLLLIMCVCFGKLDGVATIRRGFGSALLRRGLLLLLIRGVLLPMFRALLVDTVVATR